MPTVTVIREISAVVQRGLGIIPDRLPVLKHALVGCITQGHAMNTSPLGSSDLVVPSICLGIMTFGQQTDERETHTQLNNAKPAP
jgi:hypothetical protein